MDAVVDYYEILSVDKDADKATIEQAIRTMRKRGRRLEGSPDLEQRSRGERLMKLMSEAENTLLNPLSRADYNSKLERSKAQQEEESQKAHATSDRNWLQDAIDYYDQGSLNSAYFAANEATRQEPSNPFAWYVRGVVCLQQDKIDESEYAAREAYKLNPNSIDGMNLLAEVCITLEKYKEALQLAVRGHSLDETNEDMMALIVRAHMLMNNDDQAIQVAQEMVNNFKDSQRAKNLLGLCYQTDCETAMSHQAGMVFLTNMNQVQHVEKRLNEIKELGVDDNELLEWVTTTAELVTKAKQHQYVGAPTWFWALGVIVILLFVSGAVANPITWLGAAFLAYYGYNNVWPFGWQVNKRQLGPAATNSGLQ